MRDFCFDNQINLGQLIDALSAISPTFNDPPEPKSVFFEFGGLMPTTLASYRGFYDHLALGYTPDHDFPSRVTVDGLLKQLKDALGHTFTGYKGGEYEMRRTTPMWASNWGECFGTAITGVKDCGYMVVIQTAYVDH